MQYKIFLRQPNMVIHSQGLQDILAVFLLLLESLSQKVHYLSLND